MPASLGQKSITPFALVAVILAVILVAMGAIGIYLYTSAPATTSRSESSVGSVSQYVESTGQHPPSGYQDSSGQPQRMWSDYLGFVPKGYVLAPRLSNAPVTQCPPGMDSAQCQEFQASCGNGVCDPNETCLDCPIDCVPPGQLTCDPYTLRPGSPTGPCQVGGGGGYPGDTGGGGN